MRIGNLIYNRDVVKLDVQILIHALQRPPDLYVVLQLHRHLLLYQRFEEALTSQSRSTTEFKFNSVDEMGNEDSSSRGLVDLPEEEHREMLLCSELAVLKRFHWGVKNMCSLLPLSQKFNVSSGSIFRAQASQQHIALHELRLSFGSRHDVG